MRNIRVMMVGSAEQSGGGVSTVLKLMKQMPFWKKYNCFWLGTQIQRNYLWKLWYALKSNILACFIIWRYDIIHFHTVPDRICLIIQMPVFLMSLVCRKKIIFHIHMGNQLIHHVHNSLFRWCLRHTDRVVLLAYRWKTLFDTTFADLGLHTTVIYNSNNSVSATPSCAKERIILMAAYFNDNKAPDLLLKAWQTLHEDYPDWKVIMMGNGEVKRFETMASSLGLADSVMFTGYVTGEERDRIWRKASIYCMCSYEEGFPMVALEAWAYGAALVTTPVGGLPDVMEDGKNCLAYDFGDWRMLASHIKRLIDDDNLRQAISTYARATSLETFSMAKVNDSVEELYNEMINR